MTRKLTGTEEHYAAAELRQERAEARQERRIEGESERQLRKWGFELRGSPVQLNASHTVWDHYEDGRVILLYDDGYWQLIDIKDGRGTASLMAYLRTAG